MLHNLFIETSKAPTSWLHRERQFTRDLPHCDHRGAGQSTSGRARVLRGPGSETTQGLFLPQLCRSKVQSSRPGVGRSESSPLGHSCAWYVSPHSHGSWPFCISVSSLQSEPSQGVESMKLANKVGAGGRGSNSHFSADVGD